jgi:hypothetical protein
MVPTFNKEQRPQDMLEETVAFLEETRGTNQ